MQLPARRRSSPAARRRQLPQTSPSTAALPPSRHRCAPPSAPAASTGACSPQAIAVHIGAHVISYATPGNVYLTSSLLDAGPASWGVVQHEFGHQVDFLLFNAADRAQLQAALGAKDWCYETPGLQHSDHDCERFASELAWAYWPSQGNVMRPIASDGESNGMPDDQFRALVAQLVNLPARALSVAAPVKRSSRKH